LIYPQPRSDCAITQPIFAPQHDEIFVMLGVVEWEAEKSGEEKCLCIMYAILAGFVRQKDKMDTRDFVCPLENVLDRSELRAPMLFCEIWGMLSNSTKISSCWGASKSRASRVREK